MQAAYAHAMKLGYRIVVAQIRIENIAGIELHESLGFLRDAEVTNQEEIGYTYI